MKRIFSTFYQNVYLNFVNDRAHIWMARINWKFFFVIFTWKITLWNYWLLSCSWRLFGIGVNLKKKELNQRLPSFFTFISLLENGFISGAIKIPSSVLFERRSILTREVHVLSTSPFDEHPRKRHFTYRENGVYRGIN